MKVELGNQTYLVSWRSLQINEESVKLLPTPDPKFRPLKQTTCILELLNAEGKRIFLSRSSVRQHYDDTSNEVLARKLTFSKVINSTFVMPAIETVPEGKVHFTKGDRTVFWAEFLKTTRVTRRTPAVKIRLLQERIKVLEEQVSEVEALRQRVKELEGVEVKGVGIQ